MKHLKLPTLFSFLFILGTSLCTTAKGDPNPQKLIKKVSKAMGGWNKLYKLNDVQFDYNYEYVGADKKDFSQERYIFEGEHSWAKYTTHQINVMPDKEGVVIQSLANNNAALSHNGQKVTDQEAVEGTMFLRKANYFWFTMMYKLADPGTILSYEGSETILGTAYQKVILTYDRQSTGKEQNDTYILYINPKTNMVDQFYFSLPAMGVNVPVILMKVEYEEMNGIKVPAKRMVYQPNEKGEYPATPNLVQTLSNIKFNNGFTSKDFMLK